jgi:hypothetical protein
MNYRNSSTGHLLSSRYDVNNAGRSPSCVVDGTGARATCVQRQQEGVCYVFDVDEVPDSTAIAVDLKDRRAARCDG